MNPKFGAFLSVFIFVIVLVVSCYSTSKAIVKDVEAETTKTLSDLNIETVAFVHSGRDLQLTGRLSSPQLQKQLLTTLEENPAIRSVNSHISIVNPNL
jgi:ABC-type transport system involved in cytochrome bd biosynthesis fused ATPase/permease subunit